MQCVAVHTTQDASDSAQREECLDVFICVAVCCSVLQCVAVHTSQITLNDEAVRAH